MRQYGAMMKKMKAKKAAGKLESRKLEAKPVYEEAKPTNTIF